LGVDELVLERFELLVVQVELELERPIRYTLSTPQDVENLLDHLVKVHDRFSPNAVSRSNCGGSSG
jgi:hypothetical protein